MGSTREAYSIEGKGRGPKIRVRNKNQTKQQQQQKQHKRKDVSIVEVGRKPPQLAQVKPCHQAVTSAEIWLPLKPSATQTPLLKGSYQH